MNPFMVLLRPAMMTCEGPLAATIRTSGRHRRRGESDPGCVKTHTSAKCRKNNSPATHRSLSVQYDLTLRYAITPRCFYVCGEYRSFHTAKTHLGHSWPLSAAMHWPNLLCLARDPAVILATGLPTVVNACRADISEGPSLHGRVLAPNSGPVRLSLQPKMEVLRTCCQPSTIAANAAANHAGEIQWPRLRQSPPRIASSR
jgi:hypothetical protein